MIRTLLFFVMLSSALALAGETESEQAATKTTKATKPVTEQPRINSNLVLGMNVRGNKESPLSLTIVPWRSADHSTKDPKITAAWSPTISLLQPEAYRRNINAFLKSRRLLTTEQTSGMQNENQ